MRNIKFFGIGIYNYSWSEKVINKKQKRTYHIVNFADGRVNICKKENERQVLIPRKRTKKAVDTRMKVIPIVIGAFRMISKGLERGLGKLEIGGWIETIRIIELLR